METVRWGIISTGGIARQFADGLRTVPGTELLAVGSRSQESADAFGDSFDVPRRYASYEALTADPDVDVVYIGTPHAFHYENMLLALENGKHVLNEKAFAINAAQAEEAIKLARDKGLFLMEAMWTRYVPSITRVRELVSDGVIGDMRLFQADFCVNFPFDPHGRIYNPELGGGALLDLGIYPIAFASMLYGTQPSAISSLADIGETGVDEQFGATFRYDSGAMAVMSAGFRGQATQSAVIAGTKGRIEIAPPFHHPDRFRLVVDGKMPQDFWLPVGPNGYRYEAVEVVERIRAGETESPVMPLDETLALMRTMDAMRAQWGLRYPMEQ